jgi:hypothetical protein
MNPENLITFSILHTVKKENLLFCRPEQKKSLLDMCLIKKTENGYRLTLIGEKLYYNLKKEVFVS